VASDGGVLITENGHCAPPVPELFANRRWNEYELSWTFRVNVFVDLRL
jgi:hypothetical protein